MTAKIFKGSFFHAPEYGAVEYLADHLIVTNEVGVITAVVAPTDKTYHSLLEEAQATDQLVTLTDTQVGLPGFVDLHVHAPQWPQAGIALDEPLNVWLAEKTFPLEAKYEDLQFAKKVYRDLVHQLLKRGTTTVLYFATIHLESSLVLAEICADAGQRGLVGKVVMDNETNPEFYRDVSTEQALQETETFIQKVQTMSKQVLQGVYPVVTPRFVPSCTDEALAGLGQLAQKYHVHIQSHCSEGQWEHDHVYERFGKSDTEVLQDFGLLTDRSVMAHCDFLSESDGKRFAQTDTAIAHCPISNVYFANGVLPLKRLRSQGVTIGLGTDISGGFSPSLYDNIRQAVMSSRNLEEGVDTSKEPNQRGVADSRITIIEAFYLATTGGGQALSLPIGNFTLGQAFDLQVVDLAATENPLPNFLPTTPAERLAKLLYLADQSNLKAVYVQGKQVI